jgi:outer membrane protein
MISRPKKWLGAAGSALSATVWLLGSPVQAQEVDTAETSAAPDNTAPGVESRWFARVGVLGALYDSHATFATGGQVIPGATAQARDNITAIFDVGYDVTKDFAVVVMSGIPPRTAVEGRATVAALGTLGAVRFGPVFLTGVYRLPVQWVAFRPYVGTGVAHAFILEDYDGSVTQLKVHDNSGFVLQAGFEYRWSESWGLFVDYKRLWLRLNADGVLENLPVTAQITLDPNLVSAGVRYQF